MVRQTESRESTNGGHRAGLTVAKARAMHVDVESTYGTRKEVSPSSNARNSRLVLWRVVRNLGWWLDEASTVLSRHGRAARSL